MPFRSKLKRALGGNSSSSSSSKNTSTSDPSNPTNKSSTINTKRDPSNLPDNVYKPGEPMPRPKYRGPWNQAHQDKLSAFAFRFGSVSTTSSSAAATGDGEGGGGGSGSGNGIDTRKRRSSGRAGSEYSPRGSKVPAMGWAVGSGLGVGNAGSVEGRGSMSRRGSAWSAFSGFSLGSGGGGGVGSKRMGMGSRKGTGRGEHGNENGNGGVEEGEDEEDGGPANVGGLSRQHTADRPHPRGLHSTKANGTTVADTAGALNLGETGGEGSGADLSQEKTITNRGGGGGGQFTVDELASAMKSSRIQVE